MSNSSILTKLTHQPPGEEPRLGLKEKIKNWGPVRKYNSLKKKQKISLGLLSSNLLILLVIIFFIIIVPQNNNLKTASSIGLSGSNSTISNPLDQLSSANIALAISEMANLPEQTPIRNQAESQQAELSQAATNDNVISEPQVLTTALKSRADIFTYVTKPGDTVSSLAVQFGITSNSIMWSNNLSTNLLTPGTKLVIPPVTGIVYTVKSGDTIASLAQKYGTSQADLIAYNDAEVSGIQPGEQILIPNGQIQTVEEAPAWTGATYGNNGYDFGYCTWYVANILKNVPSNWGNASSWAYYAALSGWNVSSNPVVGAIAQTPYAAGGEGHVAIVEQVNSDGTIWISEMNSYGQVSMSDSAATGGWDRVDWKQVSVSSYPSYITP